MSRVFVLEGIVIHLLVASEAMDFVVLSYALPQFGSHVGTRKVLDRHAEILCPRQMDEDS